MEKRPDPIGSFLPERSRTRQDGILLATQGGDERVILHNPVQPIASDLRYRYSLAASNGLDKGTQECDHAAI
jgi:hypothetical protein